MRSILMSIGVLVLGLGASVAVSADDDGEVFGDYNVGGGVLVGGGEGVPGVDVMGGIIGNGEGIALGELKGQHYLILDGRFVSFVGGGAQITGEAQGSALFALRLIGNAGIGVQAYRIVPLNLSVEDVELEVRGTEVAGHGLIGTTVFLPVSLITKMEEASLYLAVTGGARLNSKADGTALALQPKVRFINDKFSGEARYLFTLGHDGHEKRAAIQLGLNHILRKGDQLGVLVTGASIDAAGAAGGRSIRVLEGLVFYGGNL